MYLHVVPIARETARHRLPSPLQPQTLLRKVSPMCSVSVAMLVLCVLATATASTWDFDAESQQLQAGSPERRWHAGNDPSEANKRIFIKEEVCNRNYAVCAIPLTIQALTLPYLTSPASLLGATQRLRHDKGHDGCLVSTSTSLCPRCLCRVELRSCTALAKSASLAQAQEQL